MLFRSARGAKIYASIDGYGSTCDAYHRVQMAPDGEEIVRAMALAVERSGRRLEEIGYVSLDRARKVYVLRQFHPEGFVNTYAAPAASTSPGPIVFATEAIENIPPGWRARETYRFEGPDELVEVFELAEPGKEFTTYSETRLRRVR